MSTIVLGGNTASDLESAVDTFLAADPTVQINQVDFACRDQVGMQGLEMAVMINYETGGTDLGVDTFKVLLFKGASASDLSSQINTWVAANPAFFVRGPAIDYLSQRRRLQDYMGLLIYSASASASDNWLSDGATGEAVAGATTVPVIGSNVPSSTYANGITYTPLVKDATEQYVEFEFVAGVAGTLKIGINYAMSVSDAGDVVLGLESLNLAVADDPAAALSDEGNNTVTPGAGTTLKNSSLSYVAYNIAVGDYVYCKLIRKNDAGDTHIGDLRILGITYEIE